MWMAFLVVATVADDTPRGTDLIARIEVGKLAEDLRAGREQLEPLFDSWPALGAVVDDIAFVHNMVGSTGVHSGRPLCRVGGGGPRRPR